MWVARLIVDIDESGAATVDLTMTLRFVVTLVVTFVVTRFVVTLGQPLPSLR